MPKKKKCDREKILASIAMLMREGKMNEVMAKALAKEHGVSERAVWDWRRTVLDRWTAEAELLGENGQKEDILARIRQDALDAKADKRHDVVIAARKLEAQILTLGMFALPPSKVTHEFVNAPAVPPPAPADLASDLDALPVTALIAALDRRRQGDAPVEEG